MALKIALIIRPRHGGVELETFRRVVVDLRGRGHRVTPRLTFEEGDAMRVAYGSAHAGYDLVIAAGGDGTVHEVVNGLARSRWQPRLGIVPVGTANDFAGGLGLTADLEEALGVAVHGTPTAVDVARVNRRYFINVSTGGIGAETSGETPPEAKRRLGAWAYVVTGVRSLVELRPARARFVTERGVLHDGRFLLFAVGNARQTGGGSRLTPRAEFGDGKLDVLVVPEMPMMDLLALLPDLRGGTHLNDPKIRYEQSATVRVEAARALGVHADGEPMRGDLFEYSVADRPLTVMLP